LVRSIQLLPCLGTSEHLHLWRWERKPARDFKETLKHVSANKLLSWCFPKSGSNSNKQKWHRPSTLVSCGNHHMQTRFDSSARFSHTKTFQHYASSV
jgi:hypothetical protein